MFRPDTVNDTTPEVMQLLKTLSSDTPPDSQPTLTQTGIESGTLPEIKRSVDNEVKWACEAPPMCGHVLLSSLPRVVALARRRELLVQKTRNVSTTSSPLPSTSESNVVLVRLVLSLLNYAAEETSALSPTTLTDESDDGLLPRATPTNDASSPHSWDSPHILSTFSSPTEESVRLLPWCRAETLRDENCDAADITYMANCVDEIADTQAPQRETNRTSSDGVGDYYAKAESPMSSERLAVPQQTSTDNGCACQVMLRSYPVAVFPSDVMNSLSRYWHCGPPLTHQGKDKAATVDGNKKASPPPETLKSSASPCVAEALDVFRAEVCRHERRSLRSVAHACDNLLKRLDTLASRRDAEKRTENSKTNRVEEDPEGVSSHPLKVVIPVPIYGVALSVEDNQTTRLEQVGHLTTPILREVTDEKSPLRPLTTVLHQLRWWAAEGMQSQQRYLPLPSSALVQNAASPKTSTKSSQDTATTPAPVLLFTRARLQHLLAYVAPFLKNDSSLTASKNCSSSLKTTAPGGLDVTWCCSPDLLLPACLVHCQLGISRSPSVVLLLYLDIFRSHWRRAVILRSLEQRQQNENRRPTVEEGKHNAVNAKTTPDTSPANHVDPTAAAEIFHSLLSALVSARPRVKPNVCFAVQLLSMWNKILR